MSVVHGFVRLLLLLYPRAFRARHGGALQATLDAAWARERGRRGGAFRRARLLANVLWGGVAERLRSWVIVVKNRNRGEESMAADLLKTDARIALRMVRRAPLHSGVAIATLGIGVGACVALFSVLNAVVLRPLPFEEPDRLVHLWANNPTEGAERYFVSPMDLDDFRQRSRTLSPVAGYWRTQQTLTEDGGEPERLRAYLATWDLFEALGVRPLAGRVFDEADGNPGATRVVVISDALWRSRFGGDPGLVGRTILLDGQATEVVGIVRAAQAFPNDAQVWLNINFPLQIQSRYARWLSVVARVRDGATVESARAEMESIAAQLAEEHPADAGWGVTMLELRTMLLGDASFALLLLFGAAGVVLLVSCANVAGMALLRAQERVREMALRKSLGATRFRVTAQLLMESLVLAVGGAVAGLALAALLLRALPAVVVGSLPRVETVALDGAAALVATACIALTALVVGLAPVFQLRGLALAPILTEGARGTGGRGRSRLRSAFVVAQVAAAVVLVTGGVQLARSFGRLLEIDPGFRPDNVVTMELNLQDGYPDFAAAGRFYGELESRIAMLPGVRAAGLASSLPLADANDYFQQFLLPDSPTQPDEDMRAYLRQVSPGFFPAAGIALTRGRNFMTSDRVDSAPVAIVNEAFVRRYMPDIDPVGRRVRLPTGGSDSPYQIGPLGIILRPTAEIVGVVADVKYEDLREAALPSIYYVMDQAPFRRMMLTVQTPMAPVAAASAVRGVLAEMDPRLPVADVATLRQRLETDLAPDRRNLLLMGGFGSVALLLAGIGVFGVVSYSARQRIPEFGIRLAVGASPGAILGLVLRQAVRLVAIGLLLGLVAAIPAMRLLASQLYGVQAGDPFSFLVVAVLLALTGLVAGVIPAIRATRMDPLRALHHG